MVNASETHLRTNEPDASVTPSGAALKATCDKDTILTAYGGLDGISEKIQMRRRHSTFAEWDDAHRSTLRYGEVCQFIHSNIVG